MAGEWLRAAKITAFVGLLRDDDSTRGLPGLDSVLSNLGVLSSLSSLLDRHTIQEPRHVTLDDQGVAAGAEKRILILETKAIQTDGGLNEIPRGTCAIAIGRDAIAKANGVSDLDATSIAHVIEKYLSRHIPARIYVKAQTTYFTGVGDAGDNDPWPDEWMVLLDGFTTGPTRRGNAENSDLVIHIAHFLAGLTFSSSLSASVAAGSGIPAAFSTAAFATMTSGTGIPLTPFGACAAAIGGGFSVQTDFWGYQIPSALNQSQSVGLKGFLASLAGTDLFNWTNLRTKDFGGRECSNNTPNTVRNDRALYALNRIEPIWPAWNAAAAASNWSTLYTLFNNLRNVGLAASDRSEIVGAAYNAIGYRYGVPIPLYLNEAALQPFTKLAVGRGFGEDIACATFAQLAPASFWELLTTRYTSRYQIAIAPMADRAVVMPAQPILSGAWQKIYASEIWDWNDDLQMPVPVRGVTLGSNQSGGSGVFAEGFSPVDAGFDSCEPGVFVHMDMPNWLMTWYKSPSITSSVSLEGSKKVAASAPWATGAAAVIGGVAEARAQPTPAKRTTANLLAKSYWQQERLRYRSVFITGRFRTDIGPGSTIYVEVPADRFVRDALGDGRNTIITGMVLRVTHSLDQESENASTSFQIGFVRTEAETRTGQALFADRHPFWNTITYGVPWCDSQAMREKLGNRASIMD